MARTGIFGGSFNPVHKAHLVLAQSACDHHALDNVLFVPAREPPHKPHVPLAPTEDRMEMLRLALGDNPRFEISTVELEREGPSYTLPTVLELKQRLGPECELYLILGSDSVRDMPNWWHAKELVAEVDIIALQRPKCLLEALPEFEARFGTEAAAKVRQSVVSAPLLDISSSDIRQRVRQGRPIHHLVPTSVADYILVNELYL